eukprot:ANDGO_04227.mRNA.1 Tubulin-folding cofactor E
MDRVRIEGHLGVIRYEGKLVLADGSESPDVWVGIEWDDESRGKHDGVAYGKRYFQGSSAMSCSFVKLSSLESNAAYFSSFSSSSSSSSSSAARGGGGGGGGRPGWRCKSFAQAVQDKYTTRMNKDDVAKELVGVEKIESKLQKTEYLQHVTLSFENVAVVSMDPDLSDLKALNLQSVHTVDLSYSLMSDWKQVYRLVAELPAIKVLLLSGCRFIDSLEDSVEESTAVVEKFDNQKTAHLETIVLNETMLSISRAVRVVGALFPNIKNLHLAANRLEEYDPEMIEAGFPRLSLLNLARNRISTFRGVGHPSHLHLEDNQIASIAAAEIQKCKNLTGLFLEKNPLRDIRFVDVIGLSSIRDLRLNDVSGDQVLFKRGDMIARVPSLNVLNGSPIRPAERMDAEKNYLKAAATEALERDKEKPIPDQTKWVQYNRLVQIHGDPLETARRLQTIEKGGAQLATVKLRSMVSETLHVAPVEKRLPLSLSVAKLKLLCKTLFKCEVEKMELLFKKDAADPFPTVLEDDREDLAFYGVTNEFSCEIWVQEVDLAERAAEKSAKERAFESRVREQEQFVDRTIARQKEGVSRDKAHALQNL